MSKSVPKRSIKDHFAVVPKEPKKEIKIHPLFLKKPKVEEKVSPSPQQPEPTTKATLEPTTKGKATPEPTKSMEPIKATVTAPIKSVESLPTKQPSKHRTRRPQKQTPQFDTHDYFIRQKLKRESQRLVPPPPKHFTARAPPLDRDAIEKRMNQEYPRWKKDIRCQTFFDNMMLKDNTNRKVMWCDKYRPDRVEGLLGYVPDFEYLRNWLNVLKIQKDASKKATLEGNEQVYNVILMVGGHGTGKTAAAYTTAKETGYTVFEINSSTRRAGKDVARLVGEMTASHLVRFDHQAKKRKRGETIIMRDTVKKPKRIDIAMHFKRMLTMATKETTDAEVKEVVYVEPKKEENDIVMEDEDDDEEEDDEEPALSCDNIIKDQHKQSLVLLEEVDILFEEDKGFWPAVIDLCHKSKRPIIMTCNDSSQIPFDHLNIQSTIYLDEPEKDSLLPYLQLICYSENGIVEPYDLEFLCELYHYDTRKMIDTLQLWLDSSDNRHLFAKVMGFNDLLYNDDSDGLLLLMDRLKGSSGQTKELCIKYYKQEKKQDVEKEVMGIESIYKMMESAAYADAWVGLTPKQRHQIYDIDQYDDKADMMNNNSFFIYKNPTNLDRCELGEIIENSISVMNLPCTSNNLSAWSSHWEPLCNQR
ncbi:P-loop containing nucleoside triphosphate hydrolase protein [Helicostylum pulchrum]|nr:P-loop containing nucleoside triphosphate hydrolase protein [Helicostylum pulchrum]